MDTLQSLHITWEMELNCDVYTLQNLSSALLHRTVSAIWRMKKTLLWAGGKPVSKSWQYNKTHHVWMIGGGVRNCTHTVCLTWVSLVEEAGNVKLRI
jgi:hypothetical protein